MPETQAENCLISTSSGYLLKDFIKNTAKIKHFHGRKTAIKKMLDKPSLI